MIKSKHTSSSLFSRRHAQRHVGLVKPSEGAENYDDNWFKLEPGTGNRSGYFRLITPYINYALVPRTYREPEVINRPPSNFYDGHYFDFVFEEKIIQSNQAQYIPPADISFRLVGFASKCAMFSRTHAKPQVDHSPISAGSHPDQWFTLVEGTGRRKGTYMIKSRHTGYSLFSRQHAQPYVWHVTPAEGAGNYDDNWFKLEQGTGNRTGYYRFITPYNNHALVSRRHASPQVINHPASDIYDDQYFGFMLEEMEVEKIEYDVENGKIVSSISENQGDQDLYNESDEVRDFNVDIESSQEHDASWDYSAGFPLPTGTILKGGVPHLEGSVIRVDTSVTQEFKFGEENTYSKVHTTALSVEIAPGKTVIATATTNQSNLEVPFTIYLKSKMTGCKTTTTGTWRGDTWDLTYSTKEVD